VLDWFNEKDTHIFCDFIIKWPSLPQVKRAREKTLIEFFNAHNARYTAVNQRRIVAIKTAIELTDDVAIIEPNRMLVEILVPQLKHLLDGIKRLDIEISQRYRVLDDRYLFDSLPGAGAQFAPRLLVAFGSNRNRYQVASELQKYSGVAPVIANVCGMGRTDSSILLLGPSLLSTTGGERKATQHHCSSTRLQVDQNPSQMLARP
jgi:hypothetical protein